MGGKCAGGAFVEQTFEARRECKGCVFLDGHECQVVEGREPATRCPALEEHIRFHSIKLYGSNS